MKTLTFLVHAEVFYRFYSPSYSDMDNMIFNTEYRIRAYVIFLHAYAHGGPWFIVPSREENINMLNPGLDRININVPKHGLGARSPH